MALGLEQATLYPLAGGRGVEVSEALMLPGGIGFDRTYLLSGEDVNQNRQRVGAKQAPMLATVSMGFDKFGRVVFGEGTEDEFIFPTMVGSDPDMRINEFKDQVPYLDCGDDAAKHFSRIIDKEVRLGQKTTAWVMGEGDVPVVDRKVAPVHIVAATTMEWLAQLTGNETKDARRRVRSSFVVSGTEQPEEELDWVGKVLRIDGVPIKITRTTGRCIVTGQDPDTGKRLNDVPKVFRQLAHRQIDGKDTPVIGVYGVPLIDAPRWIDTANAKVELLDD